MMRLKVKKRVLQSNGAPAFLGFMLVRKVVRSYFVV